MKNYQNLTRKRQIALVRELAVKQAGECRTPHERLKFPAFGERERREFLTLTPLDTRHLHLVALWEDCVNSVSCCGRVHNARIEKV
jgi:hypothetical protein